ncbi:MAG TPA: calcium-binding protein, partial [Solirubrobacterales bacterium]|nr:calcium-binding protein [Solirubrobacterales bacterium]
QEIFGGGGGDVLISGGAGTKLFGGADGDDCVGEATTSGCESTAAEGPTSRVEPTKVEVGEMVEGATDLAELYLVGAESGSTADTITVATAGTEPSETVAFTRSGGAEFAAPAPASGCVLQGNGAEVICTPGAPLDSVTVAGLGGNDKLSAPGLGETTSLVLLGGEGNDQLTGGELSDDTLVDGPGNDVLHGGGGDDALVSGPGRDELLGEAGNDLLIETALCEGDQLNGGDGRDNASWAKLAAPAGAGVDANLEAGEAGEIGPGGEVVCPAGTPDALVSIEDLEGSPHSDVLHGDAGPNQLLGHAGEDSYFAGAGEDSILANSGSRDAVINCGADFDTAIIDLPAIGDPTPIECEQVNGAPNGEYEVPPELTPVPEVTVPPVTSSPPVITPPTVVTPPPAAPKPDRTPPRTRLLRGPAKTLRVAPHHRAAAVFRFAASERSRFECKLDSHPYRKCRSPFRARLAPGLHTFRVFAIDAAGNRDRTPALFRLRVVTRR